jgi:hypothetical protein
LTVSKQYQNPSPTTLGVADRAKSRFPRLLKVVSRSMG